MMCCRTFSSHVSSAKYPKGPNFISVKKGLFCLEVHETGGLHPPEVTESPPFVLRFFRCTEQ